MKSKTFPLGSVLGVTSGINLDTGFAGVAEVMVFLNGNPYFPEPMVEEIYRQHPELKECTFSENWKAELDRYKNKFGETISLTN